MKSKKIFFKFNLIVIKFAKSKDKVKIDIFLQYYCTISLICIQMLPNFFIILNNAKKI